jgi:6-phosphogluconolactonase
MVRTALLDHLPVCPDQVHPIACNESPQRSADQYEAELRVYFNDAPLTFDLALLGLGEDGHIASLLPGSAALAEHRRWTAVTRRAGEEFSRITLTAPLLNQAALVLFMVTGSAKARVLKAIMGGGVDHPMLPAQLVRPLSGDLRWFVDREAGISVNCCKGETKCLSFN